MKDKYLSDFLKSFETTNNKSIMESIHKGYSCIFEGYESARDVECADDAVTMFNKHAAYNNGYGVNPVLAFLQRSGEQLKDAYSDDPNPELDFIKTTVHYEPTDGSQGYDDYEDHYTAPTANNDYEDGFAFTNRDLADLV